MSNKHVYQLITLDSLKCVVNGALAYSVFAGEKSAILPKILELIFSINGDPSVDALLLWSGTI